MPPKKKNTVAIEGLFASDTDPRRVAQRLGLAIPQHLGPISLYRFLYKEAINCLHQGWRKGNVKQVEKGVYAWHFRLLQERDREKVRLLYHNFLNVPHALHIPFAVILEQFQKHDYADGIVLLLGSLATRGALQREEAQKILGVLQTKLPVRSSFVYAIRRLLEGLNLFGRHRAVVDALDPDTKTHRLLASFLAKEATL